MFSKTPVESVVHDPKAANTVPKVTKTFQSNPIVNTFEAAASQSNLLLWFKDGITGLAKCFTNEIKYNDDQISAHRDICRKCEFSTKKNGNLTTGSQCMAPDPARNGAACGCFILCKTQVGECQLKKWTELTINGK